MSTTYDAEHPPDWIAEALARKDEPLHPELELRMCDGLFGPSLKHPLVYQVPYHPALAYTANDMLAYKKEAIATALADSDWDLYVMLHERPYRPDALERLYNRVTDEEWWVLLRDTWIDSENLWQWDHLAEWMHDDRPGRAAMMNDDERHELEAMPATVTIYRGCRPYNRRGWSWTWDKPVAERLARRLAGHDSPLVLSGKVERDKVLAHFLSRGESEIVADPADVRVYRTTKLAAE